MYTVKKNCNGLLQELHPRSAHSENLKNHFSNSEVSDLSSEKDFRHNQFTNYSDVLIFISAVYPAQSHSIVTLTKVRKGKSLET